MKCVILLSIIALALAKPSAKNGQKWRPAAPRDLSKYQLKTVEVAKKANLNNENLKRSRKSTKPMYQKGTKSFDDICGLENPPNVTGSRIVGGHEAGENQWPWQVALFIDDAWFCGGSLISDEYVMTAAHCADGATYYDIMAGAHDVRADSEPHRVEITSFEGFTHPDWYADTLYGDIALVRLPEKIEFNDFIRPACLPAASDEHNGYAGDMTTPVGWGKNADDAGGITPKLQMVENLPVITNEVCNELYGILYDGIVCIDSSGGKGVCNGDSGGSLNMVQDPTTHKWTQVGVASFVSSAGCESGDPHAFTRVSYFREWIESETGIMLH